MQPAAVEHVAGCEVGGFCLYQLDDGVDEGPMVTLAVQLVHRVEVET